MSNIYMKSANLLNYNASDMGYCYILELGDNNDASGYRYSRMAFFGKALEISQHANRYSIEPNDKEFFVYGILGFDSINNKNFILRFTNNGNFERVQLDSNIDTFVSRYCFKTGDNHIVGINFDINLNNSSNYNKYAVNTSTAYIDIEYNSGNGYMEYKSNGQTFYCGDFSSYTNLSMNYDCEFIIRGNSLLSDHHTAHSSAYYSLPRFVNYDIFDENYTAGNYQYQKYKLRYILGNAVGMSGSGGIPTTRTKGYSYMWNKLSSNVGYYNNYYTPTSLTTGFTGSLTANNTQLSKFKSNGIFLNGTSTSIFNYTSNTNYVNAPIRLSANNKIFMSIGGKLIYVSDTDNTDFIGGQVGQIQFDLNDVNIEAGNSFQTLTLMFNSYGQQISSGILRYSLDNGTNRNTTTLSISTSINISSMDFTVNNTIKLQILLNSSTSAYNFAEFNVLLY